MVVRSSHRTKYSRGRPNAKKPDVQRELPPELRVQQLLTFDQDDYDLGGVCEDSHYDRNERRHLWRPPRGLCDGAGRLGLEGPACVS